jgi:predicted ArsR family transcriptional regulator
MQDIRNKVGGSKQAIAALFLAKDWISSGELAGELGIDQANLNKVVNRLIEGGLLYRRKEGASVHFKRAARLDLINFDRDEEFSDLYEKWKGARG